MEIFRLAGHEIFPHATDFRDPARRFDPETRFGLFATNETGLVGGGSSRRINPLFTDDASDVLGQIKGLDYKPGIVKPGTQVVLDDYPTEPDDKLKKLKGEKAFRFLASTVAAIGDLKELLVATGKSRMLVVLQGIDGSGKDGTTKNVFAVDPIGMRNVAFKAPTKEEREHDFMWRIRPQAPKPGELVIFNRSHYEDVIVPWVLGQIDRAELDRRFKAIEDFERELVDGDTLILKFFLHLSKEEQLERLFERMRDPLKRFKVNASDWIMRSRWDDYRAAFEQMLTRGSTAKAPWIIVPGDAKWYRNIFIAAAVRDAMGEEAGYNPQSYATQYLAVSSEDEYEPGRSKWADELREVGVETVRNFFADIEAYEKAHPGADLLREVPEEVLEELKRAVAR